MKKKYSLIVIVIFFVVSLNGSAFADDSVPSAVIRAMESVVRVTAKCKDSTISGSGFIVSGNEDKTYIATNWHIVNDDPYEISIWVDSGISISASIFAHNSQKDLCILEIRHSVPSAALRLSTSDVKQGDAIYAVGFPVAADILSDTEIHLSSLQSCL